MRTTLNIDDELLRQAKKHGADQGKSLTRFPALTVEQLETG